MNENAGQFRTAAFGGFNRQDVLDYIEKLTQENQEKSLELERALEREETVRTQSEARFAEAEEQAAACEKLSEEVEQLRKDPPGQRPAKAGPGAGARSQVLAAPEGHRRGHRGLRPRAGPGDHSERPVPRRRDPR